MFKRLAQGALALLLLLASSARADAQTSVRIDVDRRALAVGETLQVTVTITISGRGSYDEYLPPVMTGFRVAGSALTSQNVEIINWRMRLRETRVYRAMALRRGRLIIGPAAIRVGGRTIKSQRVAVAVGKGVKPPPQPAQPGGNMGTGGPGTPGGTGGGLPPQARGEVFIAAKALPAKVYVGQQVIAVWRLYTTSDVLGYRPAKQPTADNFWIEDVRSPRRLRFRPVNVGGRQYYAAIVWRKALFPQKAGKLTVGPLAARVRTIRQFASRARMHQSNTLDIEVLPLPKQGQPADFSPQNVGSYTISATIDHKRVKAGEALSLRVVIRGAGNLKQLEVNKLPRIDGLKVYKPKVTERLRRDGGISGWRQLEYLLLPTKPGRVTIPPVQLDFFDPKQEKYRSIKTKPLTLMVVGSATAGIGGGSGSAANIIGGDIRPPHTTGSVKHRPRYNALGPLTLTLLALPMLLFVGVLGVERVRARMNKQTARSLSRASAKRVREQTSAARKAISAGDSVAFYSAVAAAIEEQLSVKLAERVEGLTRDELRAAMKKRGLDDELIDAVAEELDNCDFGRFARSASGDAQLGATLDRAIALVNRIGRASISKDDKSAARPNRLPVNGQSA